MVVKNNFQRKINFCEVEILINKIPMWNLICFPLKPPDGISHVIIFFLKKAFKDKKLDKTYK